MTGRFHIISRNGRHLALDTATGALFRVDELSAKALSAYGDGDRDSVREVLTAAGVDVNAGEREIRDLIGGLGAEAVPAVVQTCGENLRGMRALCLNVAHSCNMSCSYCFAGQGKYGKDSELMPVDVAEAAVEWLFAEAAPGVRVEIDFFGGEPLLNMEAIRAAVDRARDLSRELGNQVRFTVTTNGLLLTGDVARYVEETMSNVVISMDGRQRVHDRLRTVAGKGSYDVVRERAGEFVREREGDYWIRGTYTRLNQDFSADFMHLADLGFDRISLEPVVTADSQYRLEPGVVDRLDIEYGKIADYLLAAGKQGRDVRFFHFVLPGEGCIERRALGCGAGVDYVAITPQGDIYPCHQFVGEQEFLLGDVRRGVVRTDVQELFRGLDVYGKDGCGECWSRFFCGGGCHAASWLRHGDVRIPDASACDLQRRRLEWACYVMGETR